MVASGDRDCIDRYVRPTLAGEKIGSLAVTEPDGGSDVGHLRTAATARDGDHYVVNGAKTFITSGARADFVMTAARTGGPGAGGVSLLVVDKGTPGFAVTRGWRRWAGCAPTPPSCPTPTCGCRPANLVGAEGRGFVQIAALRQERRRAWRSRPTRARSAAWTSPWRGAGTGTHSVSPLISPPE